MNEHIVCPLCGDEDFTIIEEEYDVEDGFFSVHCRCFNSECMCGFKVHCKLEVIEVEVSEC